MAAGPRRGPDESLAALGRRLADEAAAAVPAWTRRVVAQVLDAWRHAGGPAPDAPELDAALDAAEALGRRAAVTVAEALRALAETDVDAQRTTPLEIVRRAVVPGPTIVLAGIGVPAVVRDRFAEERFPDDRYGLSPASLAALAPELGELGLAWGAAKAMAHRARHGGAVPEP